MVKNLPAVQERPELAPWFGKILEKGMAIHSSSLAWRIPWIEELSRLQSMRSQSQTQFRDYTAREHAGVPLAFPLRHRQTQTLARPMISNAWV